MTAPIKTCDYCCAVGVMPTFMDGETVCYDCLPTLPKTMREARREVVLLRAKVEQMERQESVGHVYRHGNDSHGRQWHGVHWYDPNLDVPTDTKLYTLSGAQPAPSAPSIEDELLRQSVLGLVTQYGDERAIEAYHGDLHCRKAPKDLFAEIERALETLSAPRQEE